MSNYLKAAFENDAIGSQLWNQFEAERIIGSDSFKTQTLSDARCNVLGWPLASNFLKNKTFLSRFIISIEAVSDNGPLMETNGYLLIERRALEPVILPSIRCG